MGWTHVLLPRPAAKVARGCQQQEHPMPLKTTSLEACPTIGIDIGKITFHLIGLDKMGAIVLRQKLSRNQVDIWLANMPRCLIGMEALRRAA
jgi:hypothetical protein